MSGLLNETVPVSLSTGFSKNHEESVIRRKQTTLNQHQSYNMRQKKLDEDDEIRDIIEKTSKLQIQSQLSISSKFIKFFSPLILTALSALVRIYRIDAAKYVVWDEAHFGKFASYYLKREFYFDVHPPLGKLLVALSGYLAGYDGNFVFESGKEFPDSMDFVFMRVFNCVFGILVTPLAYRTAVLAGFSHWTCWFISLMVIFEQLSLTLSKFILLDSMLLFLLYLLFLLDQPPPGMCSTKGIF